MRRAAQRSSGLAKGSGELDPSKALTDCELVGDVLLDSVEPLEPAKERQRKTRVQVTLTPSFGGRGNEVNLLI